MKIQPHAATPMPPLKSIIPTIRWLVLTQLWDLHGESGMEVAAQEIWERVRQMSPGIDYRSVLNQLHSLVEEGYVTAAHRPGNRKTKYYTPSRDPLRVTQIKSEELLDFFGANEERLLVLRTCLEDRLAQVRQGLELTALPDFASRFAESEKV